MKWVIEVDRVVKKYDGTSALNGPGFEAGRGKVLGFLGLNDTEKTRLMSAITGTMPPTEGGPRAGNKAPEDGA